MLKIMVKNSIKNVVKALTENGGCSFNKDMQEPEDGYMVSLPNHEWQNKSVDERLISAFLTAKKNLLKNERLFLGGWVDEKSEKTFIDLSINVKSLKKAKKLAKKYEQLAIFDIEAGESIYL